MEGCPDSDTNMSLVILSTILGMGIFLIRDLFNAIFHAFHTRKVVSVKSKLMDDEFNDLQTELYGTLRQTLGQCHGGFHDEPNVTGDVEL
jgi:hypothetical protein